MRSGLQRRLALALGLLSLLLMIVTSTALLTVDRMVNVWLRTARIEAEVSQLANDVTIRALLCRRYEKDFLVSIADPIERTRALNAWRSSSARLDRSVDAFAAATTSAEDQRRVELWRAALQFYHDGFQRVADGTQRAEFTTSPEALRQLQLLGENITTVIDLAVEAVESKKRLADEAGRRLERFSRQVIWGLTTTGAAALILALGWSLLFPRRLIRPILVLRDAAMRLDGGDLSARAEVSSGDELGELAMRFNQMAATIQQRTGELEAQYKTAESARSEAEAANTQIAEQLSTIKSQQALIGHLSVPILPLSDTTLVVPLVGELDGARLSLAEERILEALDRSGAQFLILDITAVPVVDTQVADGLIRMVRATQLLGAHAVLVGIRPEVAQSLVELGIDLSQITTERSLQSGMAYTIAKARPDADALRG